MVLRGADATDGHSQEFHNAKAAILGIFTRARGLATTIAPTRSSLVRARPQLPAPGRAPSLRARPAPLAPAGSVKGRALLVDREDDRAEGAEQDAVDAEGRQPVGLEEAQQE